MKSKRCSSDHSRPHRAPCLRRRIAPTAVSVSDIGEIANAMGAAAMVFHTFYLTACPFGTGPRRRSANGGPGRP